MNTIYRVQDSAGRGPWKPGFSDNWVEDRSAEEFAALKPWIEEFGLILHRRTPGYRLGCGCRALFQLRRWFTAGEYATLRRWGYHAVKLNVDRILAESKTQCVFERAQPLSESIEPVILY